MLTLVFIYRLRKYSRACGQTTTYSFERMEYQTTSTLFFKFFFSYFDSKVISALKNAET